MELFISEAEIEDASMIIDYLNQVGGESDNLTYGLNECYLNEFEEMEVIQDFIDQENSLLLCGFIDDELVSLLSIQGEQKERLKHNVHNAITVKKEYWKQKDEQYLKRNLDFPLELFNPNSLSISEFDSEKRFVSDLTELLSSSFIILDARNRKSIGVGSELMLAKMCKIPIYTICPVDSHYRKERWIHPFIYELSDKIFDSNEKLVYYLNQINKLGKLIIRRDINVNKVIDYLNSFDGGYNEGYLVTKKFWGEKPARLVKKAANLLKEKGIKGASCLDLGCGHGKNAIFLAELGFEVNAIDSSYLCIQEAKALSDLVKWKVRDIRKVQCENEKYDLVLLTGSLHCLTTKDEVEKVIETVKISTKVGGYNVISVFNDSTLTDFPSSPSANIATVSSAILFIIFKMLSWMSSPSRTSLLCL